MSCDYYVELSSRTRRDLTNVDAVTIWYHRLIAARSREEERQAVDLRGSWVRRRLEDKRIDTPDFPFWSLITAPEVDLAVLPTYALFLQFPFRLNTSYLSKDERVLYIVDNPVRREWVFQLPYVAPSSWKGSLRSALWKQGYNETHPGIRRLFGNEREAETEFRAGRLRFFPSLFSRHSLEIINPHDRERRVGKNPILLECVPAPTPSVFSLLYVPFEQGAFEQGDGDEARTRREVAEDLELLADGVQAMLRTHGFGAKTSSGCGTVEESFVPPKDRKRDNLPDGKAAFKAVLREGAALRAFRQKHGPLEQFSVDEWQELLSEDEFRECQEAQADLARHELNVQAGQATREIQSTSDLVSTLKDWAARLEEVSDDD